MNGVYPLLSSDIQDIILKHVREKFKGTHEDEEKFFCECRDEFIYQLSNFVKGIVIDTFDNHGRNRGLLTVGMIVQMPHPENEYKTAIWEVVLVNDSRAKLREVGGSFEHSISPRSAVIVLYTPDTNPPSLPKIPKIFDELAIMDDLVKEILTEEEQQKVKEWFKPKLNIPDDDLGI